MRRVISAYTLSVLLCCGAFAQVFGNLNGSVVDPTGAAVPAAKVDLYLSGGHAPVISVQTNESGEFHITSLRPATYDIRVQSAGFTDRTVANVVIDPARDNTVPPIRLELASATQ